MHRLTDHNPSQKEAFRDSRMLLSVLLSLLVISLIVIAPDSTQAQEDKVLLESGIRYPDGFDPNTVGEVAGKAYGFFQPEKGPARFSLVSKRDTYTVFASPGWYWTDFGITLKDGDEVRVVGSKTLGKDGNLYIIAQEMFVPGSGRSISFRGKDGTALWKVSTGGSVGRQGGFGSSAAGRGGPGSGGGRGRR